MREFTEYVPTTYAEAVRMIKGARAVYVRVPLNEHGMLMVKVSKAEALRGLKDCKGMDDYWIFIDEETGDAIIN